MADLAAVDAALPVQVRLSAAVSQVPLQLTLDYVYTGHASIPFAGVREQLKSFCNLLSNQVFSKQQLSIDYNGSSAGFGGGPQDQRQQRQLLAFQQQTETAKLQLQQLARLSRKLQLPLLTALCRQHLPHAGQRLQKLHPKLQGLAPELMFVAVPPEQPPAWQSGPVVMAPLLLQQQQGRDQLHQLPQGLDHHGCRHQSCSAYLAMQGQISSWLPAALAVDGALLQHQPRGLQQQHHQLAGPAPAWEADEDASAKDRDTAAGIFADVLLAAPVQLTHSFQHIQQNHHHHQQQQQQVAVALFPSHQVLLSGRCLYFEALLSQRWLSENSEGTAAGSMLVTGGDWPRQMRQLRVIAIPEADGHVAAALLTWLCTGRLEVQLPHQQHVVTLGLGVSHHQWADSAQEQSHSPVDNAADESSRSRCGSSCGSSCCHAMADAGEHCHLQQLEGLPQWQLSGCCSACHTARTLLRLWRCAELMLLSELQAAVLSALEALAWTLACR
jgi:hypothetical protein